MLKDQTSLKRLRYIDISYHFVLQALHRITYHAAHINSEKKFAVIFINHFKAESGIID
jgi:hypothetical protein